MRTCLIGGAGFIGCELARLLLASGREVVALGRRPSPSPRFPPEARYLCGDYGNRTTLRTLFAGVDEIVDLAYATVPQTSYADPVFDILGNLPPSVGLLEEAREAGARRVIIVSSGGTVYGPVERLPIDERHPTNPVSPYGITKLTIEKFGMMYHRLHGLPVTIVRPGNAYGPGQRPFTGQGLVATAIATVLAGRPVPLFGAGRTIRDYVHVSDVARGIAAALEHGAAGEAYNIGTGIGRSAAEVVEAIARLATARGLALHVEHLPARGFDVPANVLESTKLGTVSGWRAEIRFDDALPEVWDAASADHLP